MSARPESPTESPTASLRASRAGTVLRWIRDRTATWWLLFAVPLVSAIVFVESFASPLPLTDEWYFTKAIVGLQRFDLHTVEGVRDALDGMPARFGDHIVVVPFLIYWPLAELTGFDSRWFIFITVLCFAAEALLFWRYLFRRSLWAFPVALIFLCPSHYMEFLWGWQFTLSLSGMFAIAGLVVIDRMPPDGSRGVQARYLLFGLFLCLLGMSSSAGGFFAFPCALFLVTLKPMGRLLKSTCIVLMAVATALAYMKQSSGPGHQLHLGLTQMWWCFTALGATIWGSPVGLFQFGLDLLSLTGIVIVACCFAAVRRAVQIRMLSKLALPLTLTLFGLMCTASIAIARDALGNWHLQYTLPATCGAYATAYMVWSADRSKHSARPFFTLFAVLMASLFTYVKGFTDYGPDYNGYIRRIEHYARVYLEDPKVEKPHPPHLDVTPGMLLFLSAHDNPVFAEPAGPRATEPLPEGARVFLNFQEIGEAKSITVEPARLSRLTVVLPADTEARVVLARMGESELVLRRTHPVNSSLQCCEDPGVVCYSGMLVPRVLGAGEHPLQLMLAR